MLCGAARFVSHFGADGGHLPSVEPSSAYRITHSERQLVDAIARCAECGMVALPPCFIATGDYAEAEDPYYVEQAPERIDNAARLLALLPVGGRLLEVGCACGFLLVAARDLGFLVEGVEMSRWASEQARREYGLDVKTGRLEQLDLADNTYDVVVLADVIEHLTDPRGTIRAVQRILRPGGRILVLTPDVGSLVARMAGRHWWGLLDDHYFYFSRPTLRRLLEEEGFAIERLGAFGRQFPLAHWVFKLSQYNEGLHRIAMRTTGALGLGSKKLSVNLGDQMVCVARKREGE